MSIDHEHSPEAIRKRLKEGQKHSYLRDWVYGGIDGAVTTFAIVSGVEGAQLGLKPILILGLANLLADGFSMAAGNYLGTKAEKEEWEFLENYERKQIKVEPKGETEEVRQILKLKGFEGKLLEDSVDLFTKDPDRWVEIMMIEEYGLPKSIRSPIKAGFNTFNSFLICGSVPLLPFLLKCPQPFLVASILTGIVFFAIGSIKSYWTIHSWYKSGARTLFIGVLASVLAYGIGHFLKEVTP